MNQKIKLKNINFNITKYQRIESYIEDLNKNIKIKNKIDQKIINDIREIINEKIVHIKRTYIIQYIFYFGIYFSFFSFFFGEFIILSEISDLIGRVIGFFGTAIFFTGIFFTTKILDLYYQDLNLLSTQIISIYMDNQIEHKNLFKTENEYNTFINFFKKRGF